MKDTAPYGAWPAVITTDLMTSGFKGISEVRFYEGDLYWLESRPQEQGRTAIVKCGIDGGVVKDLLAEDYSARSRVHEYGGTSFLPTPAGVCFVNQVDQQVYLIDTAQKVVQITSAENMRFADFAFDYANENLIAVAEEHSKDLPEPINRLVSIDLKSGNIQPLHEGEDFYAAPKVSSDGANICWLSWNHPNMPWDGTLLWVAEFDNSVVTNARRVAGGSDESIFQPEWSPAGDLYYVSDKNNWWNLYKWLEAGSEPVVELDAEFGMPLWQLGMTRYGFIDEHTIVSSYCQAGLEFLAFIDTRTNTLETLERPHSGYHSLRTHNGQYCYIAESSTSFPAIYVGDRTSETLVFSSASVDIDTAHFSVPESVSFPTADGALAHGFFYKPENAVVKAPEDELPPLLVMIHGGPTSATSASLNLKIQYWTNRGFAVLDVNYRGSTGFGRQYRDLLKRNWGVLDVEDCEAGVRYLVSEGLVDKARVAIRGGSAGGFTVLTALALTKAFKAGTSLYGVTDLTALAADTHKFESRYLDSLIGAYPEEKTLYLERSPITHAKSIDVPVLFLQGKDDKVVPPSQAEMMIDSLTSNGIKVAYLAFEGEAHGFRKPETIRCAFGSELWFYGEVFGFKPVGAVNAVEFL